MAKDLSDEQKSSMKKTFMLFETNGNGKIALSELGILMWSHGGNLTQSQLKFIVAEENLTLPFDFSQFLSHVQAPQDEPFHRQLRDAFKVLDKDGTGYVFILDLKHILTSTREKLEPTKFNEWIREVDVGSDGKIWYE